MKQKREKRSTKIITVSIIFFLMLTLSPILTEAVTCEEAFWKCVNDPINGVIFGGAVYCINGYIFCKKYIEGNAL